MRIMVELCRYLCKFRRVALLSIRLLTHLLRFGFICGLDLTTLPTYISQPHLSPTRRMTVT